MSTTPLHHTNRRGQIKYPTTQLLNNKVINQPKTTRSPSTGRANKRHNRNEKEQASHSIVTHLMHLKVHHPLNTVCCPSCSGHLRPFRCRIHQSCCSPGSCWQCWPLWSRTNTHLINDYRKFLSRQ